MTELSRATSKPLLWEEAAAVKWLRMYVTGEFGSDSSHPDARQLHHAADLLEQRQVAPVPVAVSERLPQPEDCDAEGRCWWFTPTQSWPCFYLMKLDSTLALQVATHWCHFRALPLPSVEVEA